MQPYHAFPRRAFAITTSNTVDNDCPSGLYVGGAGNLDVILDGDTASVTLTGLAAGSFVPLHIRRVLTTTTATLLIGFKPA